jgi:7,8-dihydropterin-6-yl-methyl-4-(beta-D-ribofuranosyl)aminobenzene 5'-phosphate synthase
LNKLDLLKIDVGQVDALIVSHGHYDHLGGLMGFLEAHRPRMRKELRLYTGGEDNFCKRYTRNADCSFSDFGSPLDRHKLMALNVQSVLSEVPIIVEDHAFTTGVSASPDPSGTTGPVMAPTLGGVLLCLHAIVSPKATAVV